MKTKFTACLEELHKLAFGPAAMGKVLQQFKKTQLKSPHLPTYSAGHGNTASAINKEFGLRSQFAKRLGAPAEMIENELRPALTDLAKTQRPGTTTFAPLRGDALNFARDVGLHEVSPELATAMKQVGESPSNRRALDALIKGHEVAETQVKPTTPFLQMGHYSPDVILREHNMVQTLPAANKPAGDIVRGMRELQGERAALEAKTGFRFGEGPRISRHARRHLTNMMEE